jgi:hypothetical protein
MLLGVIHLSISILLIILHKPKKWFTLHVIFASTGIELIIIGLLILNALILDIPHGILGLIVVIVLISELVGGIIAVKKKNRNLRKAHIWISRIIYILVLIAVILGFIYFGIAYP